MASRQGTYFQREVSGTNALGAVWKEVVTTDGTDSQTGSLSIAAANNAPVYDEDGNLETDGQWIYTWDDEYWFTQV